MTGEVCDSLLELQERMGPWSDETFGDSWSDGDRAGVPSLHHLHKEVGELIDDPSNLEEWADVLILILDASRRRRIPLEKIVEAAYAKHEVNTRRRWGEPDENGVVEHVRD